MMRYLLVSLFLVSPAVMAEGAWFLALAFEHQLNADRLRVPGCHNHELTATNTVRVCNGLGPAAEITLGYEFTFGGPVMQFGLKHESWWGSGWPLNEHPETYSDSLYFQVKFGGLGAK